jgi:hypothetical protein
MSWVGETIGVGNCVGVTVGGNHTVVGVMVALGDGVSVKGRTVGVVVGDIEQADNKPVIKATSKIVFIQPNLGAIGLILPTIRSIE